MFNPDITSVITMPVMVKIHVITAFVLIGMIPYTRFIHILVYPVHYFWREYQVTIWNKRS
jgi:nitrate reductase gamma subunit